MKLRLRINQKKKSFDGVLIPREIIEKEYYATELNEIEELNEQVNILISEMDEMIEEQSGEESLFAEVLNDKGDSITKGNLNNRIKLIESKKESEDATVLEELLGYFNDDKLKAEDFAQQQSNIANYDVRNKDGKLGKQKISTAIKLAKETGTIPEDYMEEYTLLIAYQEKVNQLDKNNKAIKDKTSELDEKVTNKYSELSIEEIKTLLFDKKWMTRISEDIKRELENAVNLWISKVHTIANRYEKILSEIEAETQKSESEVKDALERMGYKW